LKDQISRAITVAPAELSRLRTQAEEIARDEVTRDVGVTERLSLDDAKQLLHSLRVHQIELELQNEELRQAQVALEASRERYFDLYDLAPVGYFTLDESGVIVEANLTGAALLGVERGTLTTTHFSRFVVKDDADEFYLHRKQLLKTGAPQSFQLRFSRPDGTVFFGSIESARSDHEGDAPVIRLLLSDISERKALEEKLRYSQNLLQTAGRIARMGGWTVHLPSNELHWTDEIYEILAFPAGAAPKLDAALLLYPPAARELISRALRACARDGTPFDLEVEIYTATRRKLSVRAIGQAMRGNDGRITAIEGAFQDITARKLSEEMHASLEAQLRESQKMEAIGTLAGGIAHDFNNLLGTILGNSELARQDSGRNWQALISLDEIQKAAHHGKDLVQQILSFSRRNPTLRRAISLAPVVEESVRLLGATLSGGMTVDYLCVSDPPAVLADPTQVKQVILNVGVNAANAMKARPGAISMILEGVTLDAESARPNLNLRPGHYARISVIDTGHGMDMKTQRRIFEPFFTTKPPGEGTGLGLAVAHGIMQTHEGAIVVHSEVGRGSKFELYFPCATSSAEALVPVEVAGPAAEGRGRHILYLDDDEAQVFMFKRLLERWGYHVFPYHEQREALAAVLSGDPRFDLVVTDFNMPGLSGLDIAQAMRDAQPDLPVIMVSGYVNDELRRAAAAAGVSELLSKPHDIEEFRDAVHRLVRPVSTVGSQQS
jgi:PAS domain S-box-containing protein